MNECDVTAVVLTVNEEQDLPQCLQSLKWCRKIILVDSGSTDKTLEIAAQWHCDIYTNHWRGFAAQRNWALQNTAIDSTWVLFIDADEVVPGALADDIVAATRSDAAAFYLCFKVMLFGVWVRRSSNFPVWHPRLCRRGAVVYRNAVTGHGETWDVNGEVRYIRTPYIHYSFSKGFTHWLAKHNRLSSMECDAFFQSIQDKIKIATLFSRDGHKRRQALRRLSFHLPMRPLLRFFYSYVWKRGFLDGRAGFVYCLLYLVYELMIQAKMIEKRVQKRSSASGSLL
ncbi:glycosyltransferase family 2 protein [candidate division KSB1 bacterium]|nr:glycosyltransferase family 2 protein [candidate division KSB1 bacterium]RQW09801.1 MAG: glycosyltransferase family 2 protein [candidate division KSB1 bacterium]